MGVFNPAIMQGSNSTNEFLREPNTFTGMQTFTQPIQTLQNNDNNNTAVGSGALANNTATAPAQITAIGWNALNNNTTAQYNTAVGAGAMRFSSGSNAYQNAALGVNACGYTSGYANTGIGFGALFLINGTNNTAVGQNSQGGTALTSGSNANTSIGVNSLGGNNTGSENTAVGVDSLSSGVSGSNNAGVGFQALAHNIGGNNNVAIGAASLRSNINSIGNTAIGTNAMVNYANNTLTNVYNTVVGAESGTAWTTTETNNTIIGANIAGTAGESNMLRIGTDNNNQVAFSTLNLKGLGLSPIYGLDNRKAITTADTSAITLYTTTSTTAIYRVSARALSTSGTSATYVISWTENATAQTQTLTITSANTEQHDTFLIQPDNNTAITAQITAITSTTLNVATTVEQLA